MGQLLIALAACSCNKHGADPAPQAPINEPSSAAFAAAGPIVEVKLGHSPSIVLRSEILEVLRAGDRSLLQAFALKEHPEGLRVTADGGRISLVGQVESGPLDFISPRAGGTSFRPIVLEAAGSGAPSGYRGSLRVWPSGSDLTVTNRLSLEEYLVSVVASEMSPAAAPLEALKAQAVAARTFALFGVQSREDRGLEATIASDTSFQAYGGAEKEHPKATEAVRATTGEVLTFRGRLFRAYFHSTCGGRTASGAEVFGESSIEPLGGVECTDCADSRWSMWQAAWSEPDLADAVRPWVSRNGVILGRIEALQPVEADASGRVRYVRVRHTGGSFEILSTKLRALLGERRDALVRSTAFTARPTEGGFLFEGKGWGHGVGLCQAGAARKGERMGYREVLKSYFPGSEVEKAY